MGAGSVPGDGTCIGFPIRMSKLGNTPYSGRWWSDGCAPFAAHLGPFFSLSSTGSISDRQMAGRGVVHQAPFF